MQPLAIRGKWKGPRNRENKRKPLPWFATGCVRRSMVRRVSTVRVRQRALQKPRTWGFSFRFNLQVVERGADPPTGSSRNGSTAVTACSDWQRPLLVKSAI
jgi:hypothetical protein